MKTLSEELGLVGAVGMVYLLALAPTFFNDVLFTCLALCGPLLLVWAILRIVRARARPAPPQSIL